METSWKWLNIFFGLFFPLCNGFPIGLEDPIADQHTQLLTGLVAVLLTICSIVFLVGCLCCRHRHGFKEFRDSPVISSTVSNLDHGHVNRVANGEFTIFTPLSPPHYNNNIFLANEQIITRTSEDYVYGDFDVRSWFHESEKDFPRINLKYIKELGRGWFGKVVEGAAKDLQNENEHSWTPVVVKILEATASRKERVLFLNDAAIYRCGSHANILSLLGRCLDTVPLLLLQEYCPQGDLKSYLRSKRETVDSLLSTDYPLLWCFQLTSALKHLHDNKITHPDLATRNCQLTSNLMLKVGDYGLASSKYPEDYYQGSPGIPVRWCSPESLTCTLTTIQPKNITPEGNIWSLGVTIWEIYECGEQPYTSLNDDEVISQVLGSNVRLARPKYPILYADYIYRLMQLCWTNAESRPTVSQISLILKDLLEVQRNSKANFLSAEEFNRRWELFKPNTIIKTDSISDGVNEEIEEPVVNITKPLSPSLNNLHGSLDNLLVGSSDIQLNSWLEDENQVDDFLNVRGTSSADQDDSLVLETSSSYSSDESNSKLKNIKPKSKINFDLTAGYNEQRNSSDNMLIFQRTSSESETEDENWRNKVESGAYTEKVRIKSRSVTDLMVLTHVDYSESESETPLPSLDFRVNYKNVRYVPKNNSENLSLTYGSEGNLLNIQDTFQDELKKLQEERRDSLLFVPDNRSQLNFNKPDNKDTLVIEESTLSNLNSSKPHIVDSPNRQLMLELNSTADIKPANQVFSVFSVTIDKFKPMHVSNKLDEIINFSNEVNCSYTFENKEPVEKLELQEPKEHLLNEEVHCTEDIQKCNNNICETSIKHISDLSNETYPNTVTYLDKGVHSVESKFDKPEMKEEMASESLNNKICEDMCNELSTQNMVVRMNEFEKSSNDEVKSETCNPQILISSDIQNDGLISFATNCDNVNYVCEYESEFRLFVEDKNQLTNTEQSESLSCDTNTNNNLQKFEVEHEQTNDCVDDHSGNDFEEVDMIISSPKIEFDLSHGQTEIMPNELTHMNVVTSTPLRRKQDIPIPPTNIYSSLNLFDTPTENHELQDNIVFSSLSRVEKQSEEEMKNLNYSLETWDNFLEKTLDDQNEALKETLFDSFSGEPHSLLFVENGDPSVDQGNQNAVDNALVLDTENVSNNTFVIRDETFTIEDNGNRTFNIDDSQPVDDENEIGISTETSILEHSSDDANNQCDWEHKGGWFLHPQTTNDEVSGSIEVSSANASSYVGFGIDDEIMAAIRNELLTKLPHAQGTSSDKVKDVDEWDSSERDEVFLKYNVYNPPLSPILEESYIEESAEVVGSKQESENEDSEWSEPCMPEPLPLDLGSQSAQTESLFKGHHQHTPSQESCCSNDTLFNLEELAYAVVDVEKDIDTIKIATGEESVKEAIVNKMVDPDMNINTQSVLHDIVKETDDNRKNINVITHSMGCETNNIENSKNLKNVSMPLKPADIIEVEDSEQMESQIKDDLTNTEYNQDTLNGTTEYTNVNSTHYVNQFILHEREYNSNNVSMNKTHSEANSVLDQTPIVFINTKVAPLPSPEDNPWKQLPASMLSYDKIISQNNTKILPATESKDVPEYNNLPVNKNTIYESHYKHDNKFKEQQKKFDINDPSYVNYNLKDGIIEEIYENIENVSDIYNEADYVNIINLENTKNNAGYVNLNENDNHDDPRNDDQSENKVINSEVSNDDIFGMLTDIKFNGPGDNQLMSTSFSESNDLNGEQDWDSGSDTRSSSSGEFIWKEGEHEESLKALQAAPQDVLEDIKPMEEISEETSDESSNMSGSNSDEEGETPEFVPSAWDKFATPTKSALRSPEKTLLKSERKAKGVWFKKQKYHCIYEYPREPESPILQSHDLWKPQIDYSSFTDWEFDADTYIPPPVDDSDTLPSTYTYQPKSSISSRNLYQLTSITDFFPSNTGLDDEFFISGSAEPFDEEVGSLSSQFFPGSSKWAVENATPDSGMEDSTPSNLSDNNELPDIEAPPSKSVQTLKKLASDAVNKYNQRACKSSVLGGLRHTRNKLKLDLPPSPNAFTSTKIFSVEPILEPVIREKPTFTTFGKSRFLVQHIDTPPSESKGKNVSFEALPYKPLIKEDTVKNDYQELYQNLHQTDEILQEKDIIKEKFGSDHCKGKIELVRGEANLLDSADEDSGIESSTLERKLGNNALLQ